MRVEGGENLARVPTLLSGIVETVMETVSNLKTTVNTLENVVDKVQGDRKKLRDDIYAMPG